MFSSNVLFILPLLHLEAYIIFIFPVWFHPQSIHRVATAAFWRNSIMLGGARLPPFTIFTITYKVTVYAPAERADTLPLFHLYPYDLCVSIIAAFIVALYYFVDGYFPKNLPITMKVD